MSFFFTKFVKFCQFSALSLSSRNLISFYLSLFLSRNIYVLFCRVDPSSFFTKVEPLDQILRIFEFHKFTHTRRQGRKVLYSLEYDLRKAIGLMHPGGMAGYLKDEETAKQEWYVP